ncbi:cysteine desulfurase family protein [Raineya orbicola]|uniref:cysteine desulfurase n=1 Tax=Raineya orbicola TaxID=2016530 RepID=A0A2N3I8W0_9BACT|nr:cysteine desulfurase family protein [Raineya orbicola]PKQ66720.1 Cysteine sulfinate desulfinase/cysteine desulfurase [Raineya orbicola]
MRVYLDNAATTPIDKMVVDAMLPFLTENFGNPSSTHWHGRHVRAEIEKARKTIAELLYASPSEIFFTSGGTEADNCVLWGAVETMQIKHLISSPIEHHAVSHTLEEISHQKQIPLHYVDLDEKGNIILTSLEKLLAQYPNALVSLMHGNNEVGNLLPLQEVAEMCKHYKAYFHSDTVQTMGHYVHNLKETPLDYLVGAAHKFHGPKGVGFMFIRQKSKIHAYITGGSQERNMRGGTENVAGIIGLAKALELAYQDMQGHQNYIKGLKKQMIEGLQASIEGVQFNGMSGNIEKSLYTVLNVSLPPSETASMVLFNLDIAGVSASGGSACSSGSEGRSHVLEALKVPAERPAVRFSFSRMNTPQEIEFATQKLAELYTPKTA